MSAARTAVYYIARPIFHSLIFVLATITSPLLHLGSFCLYGCWYAFHILGKFEASQVKRGVVHKCFIGPLTGSLQTLYIFFGIAALVGIVTGMSLHYLSGFIISLLNLDASPEEQRGRTLASYHAEERERWDAKGPIMTPGQKGEGPLRNNLRLKEDYMDRISVTQDQRSGNRFNTILEEEDSSDGF